MRRLLPWLLAAALAALAVPALATAQAVDPGTPTTIAPAPTGTTPTPDTTATTPAPPSTATTPVPTETTPAPPSTAAVPPPATTTTPPTAAQPAPAPAPTPTPTPAAADDGTPLGLVALIVFVALVVLLALAWAIAWFQGLEPPWWPRVRHSLAEFGWRASGAWSDFADWVRFGR